MSFQSLDSIRVFDPVTTNIAQGYRNTEGVASFIAPAVNMSARAGRTLVFGKEAFANLDLFRAPGAHIERVTNTFTTRNYALRQEAIGWEVTEEAARDAQTTAAQIDLRRFAVTDAAQRLMQSWEVQVASEVLNPARYEADCVTALSGGDLWSAPTADIEVQIDDAKEAVRAHTAVYPNKLVLSPQAFNALKRSKRIREFALRGTVITEKIIAEILGLDEVRVGRRLMLDQKTGQLINIYNNCALLFYQPQASTDAIVARVDANYGTPSFALTYTMVGMPVSTPERFDLDRRVFRGDLLVERSVEVLALGANQLAGGGYLFTKVV